MLSRVLSETLIAIYQFQVQHGISPSIRDIRDSVKRGHGTVQDRIRRLSEMGYLTRTSDRRRTLRLSPQAIEYLRSIGKYQGNSEAPLSQKKIPFWGEISAGYISHPSTSSEFLEFECLNPETDFSLRISGDSMIGAGIINGSNAIFKRVPDGYEPRPGTIVAAYVEGFGTTLKRFYREGPIVILRAANPQYPDQKIDTCETSIQIQGVLKMLKF